jgi:hypothetical protein
MTVINNIEIDYISYEDNEIKDAIINNDPIEEKLHVIIVISNACQYAIRYILTKEFITRMEKGESDIILYVVELAYGDQQFQITSSKNKRHLQLRTKYPLWHKENLINVGVKKLLPSNWKAFAWIDADVEFENTTWAMDTLKILNGCKDVVQLFSHCVDMDEKKEAMNIFTSFCHKYTKKMPYTSSGINYWHPGYAYACTRKAYEKMNGIYDKAILGSGDNIMAYCFIERGLKALNDTNHPNYIETVSEYEKRVNKLRIGYVPGVILHHYHGSKKNRAYGNRWKILVDHQYDPYEHVTYDDNGILVPSDKCPKSLLDDILDYFNNRNEDENIVIRNKESCIKFVKN